MNEATKELNLAYFQQQTAEKYVFNSFKELINQGSGELANTATTEAIEAYAAYRFEQGTKYGQENKDFCIEIAQKSAFEQGLKRAVLIDESMLEAERKAAFEQGKQAGAEQSKQKFYDMGWNHGLKWAAENATCSIDTFKMINGVRNKTLAYVNRDSILNGLKQEED